MSPARAAVSALFAPFVLAACVVPSSNSLEPEPAYEPPSARPVLPDDVHVRLSNHEGSAHIRIDGTSVGPLELERRGAGVISASGELRARFVLEAAPGFHGLSIGERTYRGRIRVEPHPTGGLRVINVVQLEDYVAGVVAAELVLWSAQAGELEAQAVAARTYAMGALSRDVFLWDDTRDQVYRGAFVPPSTSHGAEIAARLERGVRRSAGQILLLDGEPVDVRFHATCGGATAASDDIFPHSRGAATRSVVCEPCRRLADEESRGAAQRVRWEWSATRAELAQLARALSIGSRLVSFSVTRTDDHGRWLTLELVGDRGRTTLEADELRRRLGPTRLRSTRILATQPGAGAPIPDSQSFTGLGFTGLRFTGLGFGHGVGLCQVGSHEYAVRGWDGRRILRHYYPGAKVTRLAARP